MPRWVGTNIIIYQDNVIFADTDGTVHALDYTDGSQKWKIETGANIFGIVEEGTIGNRKAAFFGTSGNGIIAIDIDKGELVWKGVDGSNAKNPKFFQNKIYFSTEEKTEYAFTTDRACAIVSPKEGSQVDKRELKVEGKFISSFESGVEFRINDNEWQTATIDSNKWFGFVDPQTQFNPGLNTVYCRPQGEESTQYSSAGIVYDENSQKGNIVYTIDPKEPKVGQNILIKINDASEGVELEKVRVKVDNKEMEANKNITIKAPDKDKVQIEISKVGYNPIITTINVKTDKIDPILLLVGAMCVLFGAFIVYQKIIKKK
jgi:outer membrane protein assembly factor BamB